MATDISEETQFDPVHSMIELISVSDADLMEDLQQIYARVIPPA